MGQSEAFRFVCCFRIARVIPRLKPICQGAKVFAERFSEDIPAAHAAAMVYL